MAQDSVKTTETFKATVTDGLETSKIVIEPNQKTVEINGHTYKIRKWTWGEKDQAAVQSYERLPGQIKGRVDLHRFNVLTLKTCVVEWPPDINVDNLTPEEGDDLIAAVQEFAGGFRKARSDLENSPAEGSGLPVGP